MKKIVSGIILLLGVSVAVVLAFLAIKLDPVKKREDKEVSSVIEMVRSVSDSKFLNDTYNIYLNGNKHKLKFEYDVDISVNGNSKVILVIYYDGKSIFNNEVINNKISKNLKDLFLKEDIDNNVRVKDDDMNIISLDKKDYLEIRIGYLINNLKETLIIINENGEVILDDIVIRDTNKHYVSKDNEELNIFYGEKETLFKKNKNNFYYLKEVDGKLEEYKYSIIDGKLKEEKINEYEVKIK